MEQQLAIEELRKHHEGMLCTDQHVLQKLETMLNAREKTHNSWASSHGFVMLKLNNPDAALPYYIIRCCREEMFKKIEKMKLLYPHCELIYLNSYVVDPVHMYKILKGSNVITFRGNYCKPIVSEIAMVSSLADIHILMKLHLC